MRTTRFHSLHVRVPVAFFGFAYSCTYYISGCQVRLPVNGIPAGEKHKWSRAVRRSGTCAFLHLFYFYCVRNWRTISSGCATGAPSSRYNFSIVPEHMNFIFWASSQRVPGFVFRFTALFPSKVTDLEKANPSRSSPRREGISSA